MHSEAYIISDIWVDIEHFDRGGSCILVQCFGRVLTRVYWKTSKSMTMN